MQNQDYETLMDVSFYINQTSCDKLTYEVVMNTKEI